MHFRPKKKKLKWFLLLKLAARHLQNGWTCNVAAADTDPGAYGNSTVVSEGPFCLTIGQQYDILMFDCWGDGGSNFTSNDHHGIDVDMASAATDVFTFTAIVFSENELKDE